MRVNLAALSSAACEIFHGYHALRHIPEEELIDLESVRRTKRRRLARLAVRDNLVIFWVY
jgi:hypothetical protein